MESKERKTVLQIINDIISIDKQDEEEE